MELILRERIPRVVVAMEDPFPAVSGRGIRRLREEGGVEVSVGLLEEEARSLNVAFITAHTLHRPYVTLKWAQSIDGYMDRVRSSRAESPEVFSSPLHQRIVHQHQFDRPFFAAQALAQIFGGEIFRQRFWA